jgi:hypothetical protein
MNNFFIRQSSRTYFLFGVLTFLLSETVFALAWDGSQNKQYITLLAFIAFSVGATNSYFYFKNLNNANPKLTGGLVGGITATAVVFSLLFSIGIILLLL